MKLGAFIRAVCGVVLLVLLWVKPAIAASEVPFKTPSPTYNSFWEKLDRLKEDHQLQDLLEEDLERSIVVRSQIQNEVDRAFSHTTTLLNTLIGVLTFLPVLAAVSIWFIRRSVLNQIVAETKKQIQEEVATQLEAEIATELRKQAETFQQEIEQLKSEFKEQLSQLKDLFSDTQKEKDKIIQELAQLTPSPIRDSASPEIQQKIKLLTKQLERLRLANVPFTANDYVEEGKAFYFEGRFEDAIAAFDRALDLESENAKAWFSRGTALAKLQQFEEAISAYERAIAVKSDFFLAWFGLARCQAIQGRIEQALESLKAAIALNSDKSLEAVKADTAFDGLRTTEAFQELLKP
jgi:tetratricopeptide (TPR) repeat protein